MDVYNRSVCNINKWTCKIILSRPCRVMQGEREKDMIRTKADALSFLKSHKEFSDQDWIEGEFWFRYDGIKEEPFRHDYTINHETEGIIGVMEKEAINYVFRNRKRLNRLEQAAG